MKIRLTLVPLLVLLFAVPVLAQEKSVKPGINKSFKNPDVKKFVERFERDGREVYSKRDQTVKLCQIKPGDAVADIGAGTGFMTMLFAKAVGEKGKVYAVDIAKNFLKHIDEDAEKQGYKNIETVLCTQDSAELPPASVDVVYICDVYHHFEFPQKTLNSIYRAMRPGASLYLIDFERIPGKTSDWINNHVRAGKEVFKKEVEASGLEFVEEKKGVFKDNYFLRFRKTAKS